MAGTEYESPVDLLQEAQRVAEELRAAIERDDYTVVGSLFPPEYVETLTRALIVNTQAIVGGESWQEVLNHQGDDVADLREDLVGRTRMLLASRDRGAELQGDPGLVLRALYLNTMLLLAMNVSGECRMQVPYARTRQVIMPDGKVRTCCLHPTEHCFE